MVKLLVIADDFTGALDTGVQFAPFGVVTRIAVKEKDICGNLEEPVQVLILDAETRHLSPQEAYRKVYDIAMEAARKGIPSIYKKTDSALRGNIGSELQALKDAVKTEILPFVPAFPQMGRITKHGIHFVNGKPVRESVFGKDPFEPVACSFVPDIIHRQTETETVVMEQGWAVEQLLEEKDKIAVFDAAGMGDMREIGKKLQETGLLKAAAGCAGFASIFPEIMKMKRQEIPVPSLKNGLLVICGSMNPITACQLDQAEARGFKRFRLTLEQKKKPGYWQSVEGIRQMEWLFEMCRDSQNCIIDTNCSRDEDKSEEIEGLEKLRSHVADVLGKLLGEMIRRGLQKTILITGGDTFMGFMRQTETFEVEPLYEIFPGVVLSRLWIGGSPYSIISKSGGFGNEDLLIQLADKIECEEEIVWESNFA